MQLTKGLGSIALVLGALTTMSCGGDKELLSRPLDREILVDGNLEEWEGATQYLESEKVSVGVMNDADFLYFSLASGDMRTQTQVLALGFTLWFDPEGGKEKRLGIHFPLGARETGAMPRGGPPDPQELYELHESKDPEVRLLRGEEEARNIPLVSLHGVEIALGRVNGTLIYELKVPLQGQNDFVIGVEPGDVIGVGMETPEIDREKMREEMMPRMGGGHGGGMGGGGRMGGGGGGGPMGGGGRPQPPEPIKVWAKVKTAEV
jgi:hypothetical protein